MAFFPNVAALRLAKNLQTELVNAEVRLYKAGFVPSVLTTLAELDAQECDFTGYAAEVVAAWQDPGYYPLGGASIQSSVQFAAASPYTVTNTVGGFYLVDVTGADEVLLIQPFDGPGIPMGAAGQIIPLTILIPQGTPAG